jgi:Protein of unknown function (DUF2652)
MDTHDVKDAPRHLASSLHLDTVAGAAVAGTALAGGLYLARLGIRRRRSAADVAQERPSPVRAADFDGTETLFVMLDITSYTKLLSASGRDGAAQVNEAVIVLLDALMQSAKGRLAVAKLEGDAILFFAEADKLPPTDVGDILLDLFCAFDTTKRRLVMDGVLLSALSELNLKIVVHCGHAERFKFRNAVDLVGADVVLAYRLLKLGLEKCRYILSTRDAFKRLLLPDKFSHQHLRRHIPEFGETGLVLIDMPDEEPAPQDLLHPRQQASRQRLYQSKRALVAQ